MTPAHRPFVTVNFAMTADGKISTRNRTLSDFSSPRDKRKLLEIRATADAILVGRGTLEAENMSMGLPAEDLRPQRTAAGKPPLPMRVILTNSGSLRNDLRLFDKPGAPILIYTSDAMPPAARENLSQKATIHVSPGPAVDLHAMMRDLRSTHGVQRLVCEGGPGVLRSLLAAGLVDELHVTVCPLIFGGQEALTLTGIPGAFFENSIHAHLCETETINGECFLRYQIHGPADSVIS
jgi:riboflavin-specific deaminase-like protein